MLPIVTSVVGVTELKCGRRSDLGFYNVDLGDFIVDLEGFYVNFLEVMLVIWAIKAPRTIGFPYRSDSGHQYEHFSTLNRENHGVVSI